MQASPVRQSAARSPEATAPHVFKDISPAHAVDSVPAEILPSGMPHPINAARSTSSNAGAPTSHAKQVTTWVPIAQVRGPHTMAAALPQQPAATEATKARELSAPDAYVAAPPAPAAAPKLAAPVASDASSRPSAPAIPPVGKSSSPAVGFASDDLKVGSVERQEPIQVAASPAASVASSFSSDDYGIPPEAERLPHLPTLDHHPNPAASSRMPGAASLDSPTSPYKGRASRGVGYDSRSHSPAALRGSSSSRSAAPQRSGSRNSSIDADDGSPGGDDVGMDTVRARHARAATPAKLRWSTSSGTSSGASMLEPHAPGGMASDLRHGVNQEQPDSEAGSPHSFDPQSHPHIWAPTAARSTAAERSLRASTHSQAALLGDRNDESSADKGSIRGGQRWRARPAPSRSSSASSMDTEDAGLWLCLPQYSLGSDMGPGTLRFCST